MPCQLIATPLYRMLISFDLADFFFTSFAFGSNGVIDSLQFECWKNHFINSITLALALVLWSLRLFFWNSRDQINNFSFELNHSSTNIFRTIYHHRKKLHVSSVWSNNNAFTENAIGMYSMCVCVYVCVWVSHCSIENPRFWNPFWERETFVLFCDCYVVES